MSGTFNASASWIPAALRKPVKEALAAGWKPSPKRTGDGGWYIYSPKKKQKFYIPTVCNAPDTVAKRLRHMISDAYVKEGSAFEPAAPPGGAEYLSNLAKEAILQGATIIPGPVPIIRCPVCDDEFTGGEAFANHQEACDAKEKARLAAKQDKEVPVEGEPTDHLFEGDLQDVTDSNEPVHSGTISTKEETPLANEKVVAPKPGPKQVPTPVRNPETGRKQGYKWTQVSGRENPLHEILYEAVRFTRRFKDETDSKYTKRLADYIEGEGLLGKLPDADPDVQAAYVLGQIRDLLGGGEPEGSDEDAQKIKQLEDEMAQKNAKIDALGNKVSELRGILSTLSSLAEESKSEE